MARKAVYSSLITDEQMNSGEPYRVKFSYGTFSIIPQGNYYYAYKRANGKLYKVYIGKVGEITKELLHQAASRLDYKRGE